MPVYRQLLAAAWAAALPTHPNPELASDRALYAIINVAAQQMREFLRMVFCFTGRSSIMARIFCTVVVYLLAARRPMVLRYPVQACAD